jgi:hypothetical protein
MPAASLPVYHIPQKDGSSQNNKVGRESGDLDSFEAAWACHYRLGGYPVSRIYSLVGKLKYDAEGTVDDASDGCFFETFAVLPPAPVNN